MDESEEAKIAFELGMRGVVRVTMQSDSDEEEFYRLQATVNLRDLTNLVRDFNERHRANG